MIDQQLLDILACPDCKSDIYYNKTNERLICKNTACRKSYEIREDIPIMLIDEATVLSPEDHSKQVS